MHPGRSRGPRPACVGARPGRGDPRLACWRHAPLGPAFGFSGCAHRLARAGTRPRPRELLGSGVGFTCLGRARAATCRRRRVSGPAASPVPTPLPTPLGRQAPAPGRQACTDQAPQRPLPRRAALLLPQLLLVLPLVPRQGNLQVLVWKLQPPVSFFSKGLQPPRPRPHSPPPQSSTGPEPDFLWDPSTLPPAQWTVPSRSQIKGFWAVRSNKEPGLPVPATREGLGVGILPPSSAQPY